MRQYKVTLSQMVEETCEIWVLADNATDAGTFGQRIVARGDIDPIWQDGDIYGGVTLRDSVPDDSYHGEPISQYEDDRTGD